MKYFVSNPPMSYSELHLSISQSNWKIITLFYEGWKFKHTTIISTFYLSGI